MPSFADWVNEADFPCLGAKASVRTHTCDIRVYSSLRRDEDVKALAADLRAFIDVYRDPRSAFATLVAIDHETAIASESEFEDFLWHVLRDLHLEDSFQWDARYSEDPDDPSFKFSFGGSAFYVVGLNPHASRIARTYERPTLVFNPVWQFERLRDHDQLDSLIERIRARDLALQGSINPNLEFEGVLSDALQYSGRAVSENWRCPYSDWSGNGTAPVHP